MLPSLGIAPTLHRSIDALAGLATGRYRVRTQRRGAERNPNVHYVLDAHTIQERLKRAKSEPLIATTYPMIYWIGQFAAGMDSPHVCDLGGAYGELCFTLKRHLPKARFTVLEIPEVVAAARNVAELQGIEFVDVAAACDVLISSGVVMNAHEAVLAGIAQSRARGVILSSVEITSGPSYWSDVVVRKVGRRCPYVTYNRDEFVRLVEDRGYVLRDEWRHGHNNSGAWLNLQEQPEVFGFAFAARR